MSSKIYDTLKYLQRIVMPAASTFIAGLAIIYGWDVAKTVAALGLATTFLGALLESENKRWQELNK